MRHGLRHRRHRCRTRLQGSDRPDSSGDPAAHAGAICANARGRIHSESRSCRGGRQKGHGGLMVSERIHPITMPRWGMTMTEGKLVGWLAADGQAIEPGKDLLEIETTKITNVVGAPAAGVMRRQLVKEGVTVPVGTLLGVIADTGVSDNEIDDFVATQRVAAAASAEQTGEGPLPRAIAA